MDSANRTAASRVGGRDRSCLSEGGKRQGEDCLNRFSVIKRELAPLEIFAESKESGKYSVFNRKYIGIDTFRGIYQQMLASTSICFSIACSIIQVRREQNKRAFTLDS